MLIDLRSLLALDTKFPGRHCLTHIGREGYICVIAEGKRSFEGTPYDLLASKHPYLKQLLKALPDCPVRFHFPAKPIGE
jgi:ABC-type transporter Mla maintaining outer membrane lipid asymmetry ATPase subunit MlaF